MGGSILYWMIPGAVIFALLAFVTVGSDPAEGSQAGYIIAGAVTGAALGALVWAVGQLVGRRRRRRRDE